MIIGLIGPEGAGKSTAAAILAQAHKLHILPFASPLKDMIRALGVPERHLTGTPAEKAEPLPIFGGLSARHAMQTLGTEWGRNCIGEGFWGDVWERRARDLGRVIADDVRFPNEGERVRRLGGFVLCIVRSQADFERVPRHPSEDFAAVKADAIVYNDGCKHDLRVRLLQAVKAARSVNA